LRRLAGSAERIPSPINVADLRSDQAGQLALRVVFEETLQPFVEISCDAAVGYVLANLAAIARVRGDLAWARVLLDEADERVAQADDERGQADVIVRRGYLELAEGSVPEARACLERALLLRRQLNDRRGLGLALAGLGLIDTAGDYESAERHLTEARDIFRRPATAGGSLARSGGRRTSRSTRAASTTPRRRCERPWRSSARHSVTVGSLTPSADSPTWRRSEATSSVPRRCSQTRAIATPRRTIRRASRPSRLGSPRLLRRS
jgi:tetratricopeptide (TPR) repeat protein